MGKSQTYGQNSAQGFPCNIFWQSVKDSVWFFDILDSSIKYLSDYAFATNKAFQIIDDDDAHLKKNCVLKIPHMWDTEFLKVSEQ